MADIADMGNQPKRRRGLGTGDHQGRAVEVLVSRGACPYGRDRHQVRKVEGRDQWLAYVGVGIAGDGGEPGLDYIELFGNGNEPVALDGSFHQPPLIVGLLAGLAKDRHGCRDIPKGGRVGTKLLQRSVGIGGLVGRVVVDQRAFLLEDHFAQ